MFFAYFLFTGVIPCLTLIVKIRRLSLLLLLLIPILICLINLQPSKQLLILLLFDTCIFLKFRLFSFALFG